MSSSYQWSSPWIARACWLFALFLGANAIYMLVAPIRWYETTPGVVLTGPPNIHFIRDIGLIYLTIAMSFVIAARVVAASVPILLATATWLSLHGGLHIFDVAVCNLPPEQLLIDIPGVYTPGILSVLLLIWMKPDWQAARQQRASDD